MDRKESGKRDGEVIVIGPIQWGYYINKGFMLVLGLVLFFSFTFVQNNIYMYILSTIGLGFHLALLNFVYFKV
jgi:hypothetical protein